MTASSGTGPREWGEPINRRLYVVVSGPPGGGKTTLARPLALALGLPLIAKDRIKESLLDSLGVRDIEWSRQVGRATMALMYRLAADAGSAVLESTWSPGLAPADLAALEAPVVEAYCSCPPELAEARYRGRLATRHPGHHDAERLYEERWTKDRPLGVGPLVVIDTSSPVDVAAVAEAIRSAIGR